MKAVRVIGLAGWSGSGKTSLIVRLLPVLRAKGLRVSTLKHAHHGFDIDQPGKDSHAHRLAGASEVLVSSGKRFALMHELRDAQEWPLSALLGKLSPVDLVIVEGYKYERHIKIEVFRPEVGKPALYRENETIQGIASSVPLPDADVAVVALDDTQAIAELALRLAIPLDDALKRLTA
jgi:molybdopterin-guanine dinucleotide biosynthesis adapter protein